MSRIWFLIAHTNFVWSLPLFIIGAIFAVIGIAILSIPAVHLFQLIKGLVSG